MYEAPKKVSGKKLIEICVLLFLIFWGVILLINYRRYCDTKKPILMIHLKNEYDDGYTDNYVGLFYNIRYYRFINVDTCLRCRGICWNNTIFFKFFVLKPFHRK